MQPRKFSALMVFIMLIGMIVIPASSVVAQDAVVSEEAPRQLSPRAPAPKPTVIGDTDARGTARARYIVLLEAEPLALYNGGLESLAATNPGADAMAIKGAAAEAYLGYLSRQQADALDTIAAEIGRTPAVVFDYQMTLNGFTLELSPQEAASVARQSGVKAIHRDTLRYPQTDYSTDWIGAPGIWDGSATMSGVGTKGEGIVVGILDTGINMDHPSFAAVGGDGYAHTNPKDKYFGVCDPDSSVFDPAFTCNAKLIGAWDFADGGGENDGPEDNAGHGSHVASTAAGNVVDATVLTYEGVISGVAPHANIIAYDVCGLEGCSTSGILAAIDQATFDQVDVINYSIGGDARDPWIDPSALAFLAANEAGITVATSAGNSGPAAATVGSPADAPWVMSVGASTNVRVPVNSLANLSGGDRAPPADIGGQSFTPGYGPAKIVYAGDYGDPRCDEPFAPGLFDGEIVVCDYGDGGRKAKGLNILAAGAGGYVLANGEAQSNSLIAEAHYLPTTAIPYADAVALKTWLASGDDHRATISDYIISTAPANGDVMAWFSARGPNPSAQGIIKPDITGPGMAILAAYRDPEAFDFLQGTSMSSPHLAGAAALLTAAQPTWNPTEIKSAIMLTSKSDGILKEDGVMPSDPLDRGAGRVDLSKAARAGFTLDESAGGFLSVDPALGGDPTTLNLASLGHGNCINDCRWTRVLKSAQDVDVAWAVSITTPISMSIAVDPMNFTLAAGGMQTVTITADVSNAELDSWAFGQIDFTPATMAISSATTGAGHFPVAVYVGAGQPQDVTIETRRNQGQYTVQNVVTAAIGELEATIYSAPSEITQQEIGQDPTKDDPYDLDSGGVLFTLRTIEASTKFFGVATSNSTAPDLDLYVGRDVNGNGQPDADEELCKSASPQADELCQFTAPMDAGEYWILVQNWAGSGAAEDAFTLAISMLDSIETGPMTVSGPPRVEGNVPFSLTIGWNDPGMIAGDVLFGWMELRDKTNDAIDLGSSVTLRRLQDDITLSADKTTAISGDTIGYTIHELPEVTVTGDPMTYTFVVTLPDGVTYVPGSATIEPTAVVTDTITWENVDITTQSEYVMTDSATNPICDTVLGGYIDLEAFDIYAQPSISGTNFVKAVDDFFGGAQPYSFYGEAYSSLYFTADGFATVDPDVGDAPGANVDMPDSALPNGLIAPFWRDLAVVYDEATNRGVTIAGVGDGFWMIVEYDGVEPEPAGSTRDRFDFEVVMARGVDNGDGDYEIVFAYDNLKGAQSPATIGIENAAGDEARKYAYNDAQLSDGLMICYDWVGTLTFAAKVDGGEMARAAAAITTTMLEHTANAPGFGTDTATVEINIETPTAIDDGEPILIPGEGRLLFLPVIIGQ